MNDLALEIKTLATVDPKNFLLLLGLSFFFGLAFEDMYGESRLHQPGGVRTFPLLSLVGAVAYLIDPKCIVFSVGFLVLGLWLLAYYRYHMNETVKNDQNHQLAGGLVVPTSNVLAYVLGPIALIGSSWMAIGLTVSAVLLLSGRDFLHTIARTIPSDEIMGTGKFLILTGIILPLLSDQPVTHLTTLTPYTVWLAVVVVSGVSYGSYLLQRYSSPDKGVWLTAVLGGLYSSTATTVVLSRHALQKTISTSMYQSGVIMATAMMYIRMIVVIAFFNISLAKSMLPSVGALFLVSLLIAATVYFKGQHKDKEDHLEVTNKNPLELYTALTFALLFVLVTLATTFAKDAYGTAGVYTLGMLVGIVDITPFILSMAQSSIHGIDQHVVANAILIAGSSNNIVKGIYAMMFGGKKDSLLPFMVLLFLAFGGFALAFKSAWS